MTAPLSPLINLVVQYCNHQLAERQAEYDYCLRRNLTNPFIKRVHSLVEPQTRTPEEFRNHPKYTGIPVGDWMTYRAALDYANTVVPREIVCIANLDVFLDDQTTDWGVAEPALRSGVVLCLSRTEANEDGTSSRDPHLAKWAFANSQDAWLFEAPFEVPECDFEVGILGCDNAFAERVRRTGRIPLNAPSRFKIFHVDRCRGKTVPSQQRVHNLEQPVRSHRHPEKEGQFLLPDMDMVRSVDALLNSVKASDLQRYTVICDVFNRFLKASK